MKLMRNSGFRRDTLIFLVLWSAAAIGCFCVSNVAGAASLVTGAVLLIWHVIASSRRYKQMGRLAGELDRILHGYESYDLDRFSEGDLSILQSELSKLIVALRSQSDALKSDKHHLADSLADISHQLKTPLTSINLALSMLASPDTDGERREELTRDISRSLSRLEWLVTALLKISRLDAGMAELTPRCVAVSELVSAAASPLAIALEVRGVELRTRLHDDDAVTVDPAWCAEALGNILKNCMEHTPAGGTITVTGRGTPIFTELVIEDTGPGFDEKELPYIFERFYRGKNSDAQSAGIGLALARSIIQSSGGTVKAENGPDGGARFTIRFYNGAV